MIGHDDETAPGSSAVPDVGELARKRARVAAAVLCRPEAVLFTYGPGHAIEGISLAGYGPDLTDWQVAEMAKVGVHRTATGWRFDETVPLRCTGCGAGERFSHALGCARPGYHPAPVAKPAPSDDDPTAGGPALTMAEIRERYPEAWARAREATAREASALPIDPSLVASAPNPHDEIRRASFFVPEKCSCGANVAHWIDDTSPAAACNGCNAVTQQNVPAVLTSLLDGPGGLLAWVAQQGTASLGLCRLAEVVVRLRAECGRLGEGADHYSARAAELEAECDAWQRATGADSPAALTKAVEGHRARLRRWFSIPVALRDARLGQLADQLADVRHELSAESIAVAEALIDLAKGGELSPLDRAVAEVLAVELPPLRGTMAGDYLAEIEDIYRLEQERVDQATPREWLRRIGRLALAGLVCTAEKGGP